MVVCVCTPVCWYTPCSVCVSAGDGKMVKWSRKFVDLFPKKYVCVPKKV